MDRSLLLVDGFISLRTRGKSGGLKSQLNWCYATQSDTRMQAKFTTTLNSLEIFFTGEYIT